MIKASVIIPTFHRIDQTIKTISLIKTSTGLNTDFELEIILSDSSRDSTLQETVQKEFANTIIYTRPSQEGIAANKNQGAKVASHSLLIFCDSDMEVEKDTILNTIQSLQKNPTAAAVGGNVIWKGGPTDGKNDRPRPEDRMKEINGTFYIEALYSRYIATYKKVFEKVGGYDEAVFNMRGEGSDLSIRYWREGFPLTFNKNITVHHVHDVEGGIIRNVSHPEYGIAKDILLLAYKYDMLDGDYKNFTKCSAANFTKFGEEGYINTIKGIGKYYDFIIQAKPILDQQKKEMKPQYDFKYLEVFTDEALFKKCIEDSQNKLLEIRKEIFTNE